MATSVKMDESTKSRLEELQARIKLETGTRVTQQELLDRIVEHAMESEGQLLEYYRDDWEGLSAEEIDRWMEGTVSSGAGIDEDDIDEVLYQEEQL